MSYFSGNTDRPGHEDYTIGLNRPYGPRVQAVNVEKKDQRYSIKHDNPGPTVGTWRNNLAASSQRRNLLFVAYGSDIHVWIPSGPFQLLGSQAEMVIKPVMKEPLADGYIDPTNPHTINTILVDELGRDEVLLLATDSGNVCGYHVESIFGAVKRCARSRQERPFDGAEVTPFFVENVGMSAWGLATHKFARLIAISANTGQIIVYAFALVDPSAEGLVDVVSTSDSDGVNATHADQTWVSIHTIKQLRELQKFMPRFYRSRNLRLTYRGHFDNIPHVSFANFDLDSNGMWMASTDISNRVIIWRIWDDLGPYRVYSPGHPLNNPPQRGWAVIPLDPRTFRRQKLKEDACGCEPGSALIASRTILDVSHAIENVPDASQIFFYDTPASKQSRGLGDLIECLPEDLFCSDSAGPSQSGKQEDHADDESPNDSDFDDGSQRLTRAKRPLASLFEEEDEPPAGMSFIYPEFFHGLGGLSGKDLQILEERPVHPAHQPQFFPTIHFSEHHISMAPYPVDSDFHLLSRNPLFQRFTLDQEMHSACDRFNMVKYIPDMGIVIAASQKGRVAIISLTWQEDIGYAFRLDRIVPLASQEDHHERPMTPLLGMAVGPMPGYEIPQDVPCIPRGVDPDDWLEFNYRILNPEDDTSSSSPTSADAIPSAGEDAGARTGAVSFTYRRRSMESSDFDEEANEGAKPLSDSGSEKQKESQGDHSSVSSSSNDIGEFTLPELHAFASRSYRPDENWHGTQPSRRYRLILLFCDHTVMTYEFWHNWGGEANQEGADHIA